MRWPSRQLSFVGLAAAAVAVTILLGCGIQNSSELATVESDAGAPLSDARPSFKVFRGPPEFLPNGVRQVLEHLDETASNLWTQAITGGPAQVWAVADHRRVCLVSLQNHAVGSVCSDLAKAVSDGIAITFLPQQGKPSRAGKRLIVGLVPDEKKVLVARTGQQTQRIRAVNGVVYYEDNVPAPPDWFTTE